ncbi:hypothetical protein AGMMS49957_09610 [Synergistales bacterium]|nr:hypothetical protein AGMMS49957_09610 [Synergistales bacterium]
MKSQKQLFVFVFALLVLFCVTPAMSAMLAMSDASFEAPDMASMIQQNPDFSTYPGYDGVIWLKQREYALAEDGGVERRNLWVILGRKGLDVRWLKWDIAIPEGWEGRRGAVEFQAASVYSPGEGKKIADIAPSAGDGVTRSVSFPSEALPDEFILVIAWSELFPNKLSIDDLVWVSESLPVWEDVTLATVPATQQFYYTSNTGVEPEQRQTGTSILYEWRVINTLPDARVSLLDSPRSYIAFGVREGKDGAARLLKSLEPAVMARFAKIAPKGLDTRIFWILAYPPNTGEPICDGMAVSPVLAVSDNKNTRYYDLKETSYESLSASMSKKEDSVSLRGREIWGVNDEGKTEKRQIPNLSASQNRLGARFDMSLDKNGILSGTVKITALEAWGDLFSGLDLKDVMSEIFPQPIRWGEIKKTGKNALEITAVFAPVQAIKSSDGDRVMVSIPSMRPKCITNLRPDASGPKTLRFPFTVDARFVLALPEGTESVLLPEPAESDRAKIKSSVTYKYRKRIMTAEGRLTVGAVKLDEESAPALGTAITNWQNLMTKPLPIKIKVGATAPGRPRP